MKPSQKNNNKSSFVAVIIWVVLTAVCIQGYLLIAKKARPVSPVDKPPAKTVSAKEKKPLPAKLPEPAQKTAVPVKQPEIGTYKITIVLDDWGYNRTHCKDLSEYPVPLGVAILPNLPYSKDVIQCATEYGKEPMLHLPIEPHNLKEAFDPEYSLTTEMGPSAVKKKLVMILDEMKGVVGVNNHQGSKGTEDDALMTLVMAEIKRRGLFFLDSYTSDRSICGDVAKKLKMKASRRDVFLDNRNERKFIERQFEDAVRIAKRRGHVLVIGHDRALTLQILKEQIKKLQDQGFEFISVRDYTKLYAHPWN